MSERPVIRQLLDSLQGDAPVQDVRVCVHWTAVLGRRCGLASTLRNSGAGHGHNRVRDVGQLHTKSCRELAEYATSGDLMEASIGMAAINSLLEPDLSHAVELNAADLLIRRGRGKNVVVVGHFPFTDRLRQAGIDLHVLELQPGPGDLPAEMAATIVPQADVVGITGTTLINGTFDGIIKLCRPDALVVVVGPSTPLSPVLFDLGVDVLSGTLVADAVETLRYISQGASFRELRGVKLITMARDPGHINSL